jgi:hypothetical protein
MGTGALKINESLLFHLAQSLALFRLVGGIEPLNLGNNHFLPLDPFQFLTQTGVTVQCAEGASTIHFGMSIAALKSLVDGSVEEGFQGDARGPEMASDEQFADFLSRFEWMAANKAWTDEMKILNLRRRLRNTLIEEMLDFQLKLPATYLDFAKACYELSSRGRRRFKRSESDENKEDDVSDMSEAPGGGDPDEKEAVGEEYESGSECVGIALCWIARSPIGWAG